MNVLHRLARSLAFYPVTCTYAVAAGLIAAVAAGLIRWYVGLALLTGAAACVLLVAMYREVTRIHRLVNSQHDALVATVEQMGARIDQLLRTLTDADVAIPHDDSGADR